MDNNENKELETVQPAPAEPVEAPAAPVEAPAEPTPEPTPEPEPIPVKPAEPTPEPTPMPAPVEVPAPEPTPVAQTADIPEEYKPISMWGYLGYQILFAIPLVGFILILVFSFGGKKNINVRNFARAYLLAFVIGLILCGIIFAIFGAAIFGATSSGGFDTINYYN